MAVAEQRWQGGGSVWLLLLYGVNPVNTAVFTEFQH